MLIEIESFYGDVLLSGKVSSIEQLKQQMMAVLNDIGPENFVVTFSTRYGYDIYPYDAAVNVDYVIDLDIYYVYEPSY